MFDVQKGSDKRKTKHIKNTVAVFHAGLAYASKAADRFGK